MTCKHCGATVEAFDQFCSVCGKSLADEPEVTSPTAPEAVSQADAAEDSFPASKRPVKLYPPENSSGSAAGTQIPTAIYLSESVQSVAAATDAVLESAAAAASPESAPKTPTDQPAAAPNSPAPQPKNPASADKPDTKVYAPQRGTQHTGRKKAARRRRLQTILTAVLGLIACAAVGYAIYINVNTGTLRGQVRKLNSEKAACEQTIADLQADVSALQEDLATAGTDNASLQEQLTSLQDQLATANTNMNQYSYDKDTAERNLENAKTELAAMKETLAGLEAQLTQLQADYTTLQESNTTLQSDYDALKTESTTDKETLNFYQEHVVFVVGTRTGSYYHRYGCSDFSTTSSFYAYNVKLAESNGYKPCPKCCADLVATSGTDQDVITPSPSASPSPSSSPVSIFGGLFQ